MTLESFLKAVAALELGNPGARGGVKRSDVLELRRLLEGALTYDEFVTDCIANDLRAWAAWEAQGWRGIKPPVADIPPRGISIRLFFWPPGAVADPHEHTSWTASSVFHNELEVQTYDWDETIRQRTVVPKNLHCARRGQVGYVFEPCIHSPRNTTARMTTSLHVLHADDHPRLERAFGPIHGLTTYEDSERTNETDAPSSAVLVARANALRETRAAVFSAHVDALFATHPTKTEQWLRNLSLAADPLLRAFAQDAEKRLDASWTRFGTALTRREDP
jgi:hypothetical protein